MQKSDQPQKKQNLALLILATSLMLVFLFLVAYVAFILGKEEGKRRKKDTVISETTTNKSENTSTTDTTEDNQETEQKVFTHEDYPNLKIPYSSDWRVASEQEEDDNSPGAKVTTITFVKNNHKLEYKITPLVMFGGVPQCSENKNIYQIEGHWYRIKEKGSYIYDSTVSEKGVEYKTGSSFEEIIELNLSSSEDKDKYVFCHYDVPIGGTDTAYKRPENIDFEPGVEYIGGVSISLYPPVQENEEIVEEADQIVINSNLE